MEIGILVRLALLWLGNHRRLMTRGRWELDRWRRNRSQHMRLRRYNRRNMVDVFGAALDPHPKTRPLNFEFGELFLCNQLDQLSNFLLVHLWISKSANCQHSYLNRYVTENSPNRPFLNLFFGLGHQFQRA